MTKESQGQVIVEAMNLMNYDAMALSETDLQLGLDLLRQRIKEARFPVLSANLVMHSTGELFTAPYTVLDVGGHKVAIVGLTGGGGSVAAGSLAIVDPTAALQAYMGELRTLADIIIVLSDLGWEGNVRLAEAVPGIDIIIGSGDSQVSTERWQSPQTHTLVCQPDPAARKNPGWIVTVVRVGVDGAGVVTAYGGDAVELDNLWHDDEDVERLIDGYSAQ